MKWDIVFQESQGYMCTLLCRWYVATSPFRSLWRKLVTYLNSLYGNLLIHKTEHSVPRVTTVLSSGIDKVLLCSIYSELGTFFSISFMQILCTLQWSALISVFWEPWLYLFSFFTTKKTVQEGKNKESQLTDQVDALLICLLPVYSQLATALPLLPICMYIEMKGSGTNQN